MVEIAHDAAGGMISPGMVRFQTVLDGGKKSNGI
jgi:hypothetical protein